MTKYFHILLNPLIYLFLILGILFWSYVGLRLFKYPENHSGWNILWLLGLFLPLAGFSLADYFLNQNRFSLIVAIFAVISALAVAAFYQFNILIPYEIWLKRGMPNRPF